MDWTDIPGLQIQTSTMFSSNEDKVASNAGIPGPGIPVADLSAVDRRATVDDLDHENGHDFSQTVGLPLDGPIRCAGCHKEGRNKQFLFEKDFNTHATESHRNMVVHWECQKCGKKYLRIHQLKCHLPKCKGAVEDTDGEFRCSMCDTAFETQRGLSTHERHRHPTLRNEKRRGAGGAGPAAAKKGRKATVWSEEETALLRELDRLHGGSTRVNVRIREHLLGKTLKQISDKRRQLKPREKEDECTTSEESGAEAVGHSLEEAPTRPDSDDSSQVPPLSRAWQEIMKEAISAPGPEIVEWASIVRNIEMLAIDEEASNEQLEGVVGDVLSVLLGNEPATRPRENRGRTGQQNAGSEGARFSRRTRRRRFRCNRYQELYKKCPRKLADIAIMGSNIDQVELEVCYPQTEEIERLYTALWGKEGPSDVNLDSGGGMAGTDLTGEVWVPVGANEIIKRIAKMKPGTATGPDGVKKTHIKRVGAVQVLAKLFNLLLLKGYYPKQCKANRTTLIPKPGKDTKDARNWRPITIGSLIGRLLSNMIDSRIRDNVSLSQRRLHERQ